MYCDNVSLVNIFIGYLDSICLNCFHVCHCCFWETMIIKFVNFSHFYKGKLSILGSKSKQTKSCTGTYIFIYLCRPWSYIKQTGNYSYGIPNFIFDILERNVLLIKDLCCSPRVCDNELPVCKIFIEKMYSIFYLLEVSCKRKSLEAFLISIKYFCINMLSTIN